MTRSLVSAAALGAAVFLVIAIAGRTAHAQRPPQPFAPDWGMLEGWQVFTQKGCGKCHAVRGVGGGVGPDLGRIRTGTSFFEVGAAMWNHLPRMGAQMREARIERARLTPTETSKLIAFLFTAQYLDDSGDPKRGEPLFTAKSCATCHQVGGHGHGLVGPPLDSMKRANSPVLVAAAMWNHAPQMNEAFKQIAIASPKFEDRELLDLIAFIVATAAPTTADTQQVIPGTPDHGRVLFADKKCASCHAVGGKGAHVGPDLGRAGHHLSLTSFAAQMWNHAPVMMARMKERNIAPPTLSGQDMADVLAYLYVSRYFEPATNARRGADLLRTKGCLGCHAVAGKGARVGGDFARSGVVGSPSAVLAAMWNHSWLMETKAAQRGVAWPELQGADLGDIAAYLGTLSRAKAGTSTKAGASSVR